MNKKKKLLIAIILIIIIIIGFIFAFYFNYKKSDFTLDEKQWIEENKNKVVDISILNEIPALSYNGNGLIFDFLSDVEKDLGLTFNTIAYRITDTKESDYNFKLVDKKKKNDILVLRDNYVLVLKDNITFSKLENIKNLNIGILNDDEKLLKSLLNENNNFTLFEDSNTLINNLNSEENSLDGIIILKTLITENLIKDDLTIAYQFEGLTKDYVLSLNGDEVLNNILKKTYKTWYNDKFNTVYNESLLKQYYDFSNIKDSEQTSIKSKKYVYGFVENGIYDSLNGSKLKGINNLLLKEFSNFSGVSITYKKYDNINSLISDYNASKINLFLNNYNFLNLIISIHYF